MALSVAETWDEPDWAVDDEIPDEGVPGPSPPIPPPLLPPVPTEESLVPPPSHDAFTAAAVPAALDDLVFNALDDGLHEYEAQDHWYEVDIPGISDIPAPPPYEAPGANDTGASTVGCCHTSVGYGEEVCAAPSETVNLDLIEDDYSYEGPVYRSGEITVEFCLELMEWQREQKTLMKRYAYEIVLDAIKLLRNLDTVVSVEVPEGEEITVCGDIHGQYYDLLNILEMNGCPSECNPYVFNGDLVDRGSFSVEVVLALFAWKLLYPQHLHLARGNHETRHMNRIFGFEGEVRSKCDEGLYALFCEAFCFLPLCHVINNKVFVVHGGLFSQDDVTLDDIRQVDRVREPPDEGLMTEMLWSDPQPGWGRAPSKRGVGVAFGLDVTENFLETNGLELVIRSHEMKEDGFEVEHGGKLITVFSAPNYCDQMGNMGAYIRLDGATMTPTMRSFAAVPHPPVMAMQYANPLFFFWS